MPRDLTLKRRLHLAGLTVIEVDGYEQRGSDLFVPKGSVNHHTAGPRSGVAPSLGVCIGGRSDLPGPLCNTYGDRTDTLAVYLVAAGRANHAGTGGWKGLVGNSSVYGHEEDHSGLSGEPLSPIRYDRMVRVHAAFAYGKFNPLDMTCQHWEWTTRKIDFQRAHIAPNQFRIDVHARLLQMLRHESEAEMTPEQDARLTRVESALDHLTNVMTQVMHDLVPRETARENVRNVRRIGFEVGAQGIEGTVPEYEVS